MSNVKMPHVKMLYCKISCAYIMLCLCILYSMILVSCVLVSMDRILTSHYAALATCSCIHQTSTGWKKLHVQKSVSLLGLLAFYIQLS